MSDRTLNRTPPLNKEALDREALANDLLRSLSASARSRLLEHAALRAMRVKQVVFDIDKPIDAVYFPLRGVVSVLSAVLSGEAVETGTIGPEGMTGIPILLGADRISTQAFWQVAGTAIVVSADRFRDAIENERELRALCGRYAVAFLGQTAQTSACNRLHSIRQRCARWLLQTHDRARASHFGLSHQFLAQMLGVRRATVSVVAAELQRSGLIEYTYRQVTVVDRAGLEAAACDCYRITRAELDRLVHGQAVPSLFAGVTLSHLGETALKAPSESNASAISVQPATDDERERH